ncbi:PRI1 primase, partial [Alectura lathami]|nr:PRI1 primase [Alectura lathami]
EDLGMKHRLWVYSGRRGVHCWVCDDAVRKWSPSLRAAAVEYLSLVKVGARRLGGPACLAHADHAVSAGWSGDREEAGLCLALRRAWGGCTGEQGLAVTVISLNCWPQHREPLQSEFPKKRDSVQRWELLKGRMERSRVRSGRSTACYADWEVMLQYCFPRLDINVSKGVGHLLKSPFSVHPKTGRISVPLDLQRLEQFDPFTVPTISRSGGRGVSGAGLGPAGGPGPGSRSAPTPADYRKTSLVPYVRVFEQFLEEMERGRRAERLRRS